MRIPYLVNKSHRCDTQCFKEPGSEECSHGQMIHHCENSFCIRQSRNILFYAIAALVARVQKLEGLVPGAYSLSE